MEWLIKSPFVNIDTQTHVNTIVYEKNRVKLSIPFVDMKLWCKSS